jgi:large subunit ribosomal protein L3
MAIGVVGKKRGMTRVFGEDGTSTPVTVIEVEPNRVSQVKTEGRDGYRALQVTTGSRRANRVTRPLAGHFGKAGVGAGRGLWEFRLRQGEGEDLEVGIDLKADLFAPGQKVDVRGTTIGKGFAGTLKRHHFGGGDATHGASLVHRAPGSIGQRQTPGRVMKGKRMAGQLGNVQRCAQNLEVVRVDVERNLLLIKGAVPGPAGGDVVVTPAAKVRRRRAGHGA